MLHKHKFPINCFRSEAVRAIPRSSMLLSSRFHVTFFPEQKLKIPKQILGSSEHKKNLLRWNLNDDSVWPSHFGFVLERNGILRPWRVRVREFDSEWPLCAWLFVHVLGNRGRNSSFLNTGAHCCVLTSSLEFTESPWIKCCSNVNESFTESTERGHWNDNF